jgi:hypothetical protein
MRLTQDQLEYVFDRTTGYCHLCHGKLAFCNYALRDERGAWEIEHSVPRARGGITAINGRPATWVAVVLAIAILRCSSHRIGGPVHA